MDKKHINKDKFWKDLKLLLIYIVQIINNLEYLQNNNLKSYTFDSCHLLN